MNLSIHIHMHCNIKLAKTLIEFEPHSFLTSTKWGGKKETLRKYIKREDLDDPTQTKKELNEKKDPFHKAAFASKWINFDDKSNITNYEEEWRGYLEQRATTELAITESWGMGPGESTRESSSLVEDFFLRWNRDLIEFWWVCMKFSSSPFFTTASILKFALFKWYWFKIFSSFYAYT